MVKFNLSRLLGERRMTQSELSRKTGIRRSTINELYHEIALSIKFEHINKICEVLNCSTENLFGYTPDKVKTTGKNLILEDHGNRKKHR